MTVIIRISFFLSNNYNNRIISRSGDGDVNVFTNDDDFNSSNYSAPLNRTCGKAYADIISYMLEEISSSVDAIVGGRVII